jgi:hypothetical protein
MFETKKFPDSKKIHLSTMIFYSSYSDLGVAALLNSHFVTVSDELLHLHLLFLEKYFFDNFCATLVTPPVVLVEFYISEALLCRTLLATLVKFA